MSSNLMVQNLQKSYVVEKAWISEALILHSTNLS